METLSEYRSYSARRDILERRISGYENEVECVASWGVDPSEIKDEIERLLRENASNKRELVWLDAKLAAIDFALETLTEKERFVIDRYHIEMLGWNKVVEQFEQKFGIAYTDRHLRRIRDTAMEKLSKILSR